VLRLYLYLYTVHATLPSKHSECQIKYTISTCKKTYNMNNDYYLSTISVSVRDNSNNSELILILHHRLDILLLCCAAATLATVNSHWSLTRSWFLSISCILFTRVRPLFSNCRSRSMQAHIAHVNCVYVLYIEILV